MRSIEVCKFSVAAALCATMMGCGAGTTDAGLDTALNPEVETDTVSEALRCNGGSTDPVCVWKANWSSLKGINAVDIAGGHYSSPAVCVSWWEQAPGETRNGWLAVTTDQNSKYEVVAFNGNVSPSRSASWSVYGASKKWSSKPTCINREAATWTDGTPVGGFLIAGKVLGSTTPPTNDAAHNKIYVSAGRFAPWNVSVPWQNPNFVTSFEEVDPAHRVYATGGLPALGSVVEGNGFGAPAAVLVFMGTDQQTIYAHTHALPYTNSAGATNGLWSQRLTGPTLPCDASGCWKVSGTPSIIREVVTFQVVVHAVRGTAHRLYRTYFYSDGAAGHFSQVTGSPSPTWAQLTVPGVSETTAWLEGDPWVTYDPNIGDTLYFRKGTAIKQASFSGSTFAASPQPVYKVNNKTFASSPAAIGGVPFDMGSHVALAVGTDKALYYIDSLGDLVP